VVEVCRYRTAKGQVFWKAGTRLHPGYVRTLEVVQGVEERARDRGDNRRRKRSTAGPTPGHMDRVGAGDVTHDVGVDRSGDTIPR